MHFLKKITFFLSMLVLFSSCDKTPLSKKPQVIVSIPSYIFFVKKIAGETIDIKSLIPIAGDPHLFEPSFEQVKLITKAKMWFKLGEPFENTLLEFLKNNNTKIKIIDLRDNIVLLKKSCSCRGDLLQDRHIWLSPNLAKVQTKNITEALIENFPEHRQYYEKNLKALLEELENLNKTFIERLAPLQTKAFLISHPSFSYLCKDYDLEQIPIEEEGKEPSTKGLQNILSKAASKNVKIVFVQNQYDNRAAKIIAEKLKLKIVPIDPYSPNYTQTLLDFIDALSSNL